MPTPQSYYALNAKHEALRARAYLYLMSDECPSIRGPLAAALFDLVGDMSETEAYEAIAAEAATH